MYLLLEIVLCFCASSVYSDTVIETNLTSTYRFDVTGKSAIDFKIKACSKVSISLMDTTQTLKYNVSFGMDKVTIAKIQQTSSTVNDVIEMWSGLKCNCFNSLWVAWIYFQNCIKAGIGIHGDGEFINLTDDSFKSGISITNFEVSSTSPAYWIFDSEENSIYACTSAAPGTNATAVNTTMTTSPTANMIQRNLSATTPQCICSCYNITYTPLTNYELLQKIEQLRSDLAVDTKKTSRYKRSLISTADERSSSKCIGSFSIVILVIVISVILLMDLRHYAPKIFPR